MPRSIDTNVLVRALVDEKNEQSRIAAAILTTETIHVPVTVMLEAEWVLRSSYNLSRETVCELFSCVLGLKNVEVDQRSAVLDAMSLHESGFDFADALHIHLSKGAEALLTFDKKLLKIAGKTGLPLSVLEPRVI